MSIDNLKTRLNYYGKTAEDRIIEDKRRSLDKPLLYSYQAFTISLQDENDPSKFNRDFRALLNANKLNLDFDNKILSIPYKAIQLNAPRIGKTSQGQVETKVKCGDVFYVAENQTYWIIYMQFLNERAYFRAEVRLCQNVIEIDGVTYHVYIRGPIEQSIAWKTKKGTIWNDLNYTKVMFITKNEQTLDFFHRFAKVEIDNNMWEVQAINTDGGDGIIKVALKETYNNTIEKEGELFNQQQKEEHEKIEKEQGLPPEAYISGPKEVKPYDIVTYKINGLPYEQDAIWKINNKKASILSVGDFDVTMEITTGKQGDIELAYIYGDNEDDKVIYQIHINSL